MDAKSALFTVLRWSWLIVLATALAAGMTYRSVSRVPRVYQADATLLVGHTLQTENPNPGDIETSQTLAQSYVQLVRSQPLLQATIDALHLPTTWYALSPEVNGTVISGTETITISVVDRDPKVAQAVANELARQLILQSPTPREDDPQRQFTNQQMQQLQTQIKSAQAQIADLQKKADQETSAQALQDERNQINVIQQHVDAWQNTYAKLSNFYQGSQTNYLSIVQPAVLPTSPLGTSLKYSVGLSGGIGFALALAGILLVEFLDDTIKTERNLDRALGVPILGGLGRVRGIRQAADSLFALNAPTSSAAEAVRLLGATVRASIGRESAVVMITSPGPADGKSTIAANLAITLAHLGQRVILIDANLRRPALHRLFDLPNREGLSTALLDPERNLENLLANATVPNLQILPSGPLPVNPGDLLASDVMKARLGELRGKADVVIVDTPAVLGAADVALLGAMVDRVYFVARARRTRFPMARRAREALDHVGVKLSGAIFNGYELGRRTYQRYYAIEATSSVEGPAPECPLLGLRTDRSSVVLAASAEHRCYSGAQPEKIDLAHQQKFCLGSAYGTCPRFAPARTYPSRTAPSPDSPTRTIRAEAE